MLPNCNIPNCNIMKTTEISREFAEKIETADLKAWINMFENAPADFAEKFQMETKCVDDVVVFHCRKIPFPHFNSVSNLGLSKPATAETLDKILAIYEEANSSKFYIHYNPFLSPDELPEMLSARDLQVKSGWERIYRDDAPLDDSAQTDFHNIKKVTAETALHWANFVSDIYGLPTAPWLASLVGLPEWHHYIETDGERITAARTMYLDAEDKTAWLGIDAPVPGIMIPTYDADFRICRSIVADGLRLGAKLFVADIEKPAPEMNATPYQNFASIGFRHAYLRSNYMH